MFYMISYEVSCALTNWKVPLIGKHDEWFTLWIQCGLGPNVIEVQIELNHNAILGVKLALLAWDFKIFIGIY